MTHSYYLLQLKESIVLYIEQEIWKKYHLFLMEDRKMCTTIPSLKWDDPMRQGGLEPPLNQSANRCPDRRHGVIETVPHEYVWDRNTAGLTYKTDLQRWSRQKSLRGVTVSE